MTNYLNIGFVHGLQGNINLNAQEIGLNTLKKEVGQTVEGKTVYIVGRFMKFWCKEDMGRIF